MDTKELRKTLADLLDDSIAMGRRVADGIADEFFDTLEAQGWRVVPADAVVLSKDAELGEHKAGLAKYGVTLKSEGPAAYDPTLPSGAAPQGEKR